MDNVADAATAATAPLTFPQLPGAEFCGDEAVREHGHMAAQYEGVVSAFELTGDEADLWESLRALGYEPGEIRWHVEHRGERMPQAYVVGEA